MATIDEMIQRFQRIREQTPQMIENAFNDESAMAAELNRKQLDKGQKSDGSFLPNYKSKSRSGPIRLYDTGDFWRGIRFIADNDKITSFSDDRKNSLLQDKYGEKILGLTAQSKIELQPYISDNYLIQVKKIAYGR